MFFLLKCLVYILPLKLLSQLVGYLMSFESPKWLVSIMKKGYVYFVKVDMTESRSPLDSFSSVEQLFTRQLKTELRPTTSNWVYPVDGTVLTQGPLQSELKAKGVDYKIAELLFGKGSKEQLSTNSWHSNVYLSPKDYHRVHSPTAGKLTKIEYFTGKLIPVMPYFAKKMPELFSLNERMVFHIESEFNEKMYLVMVGSVNVGKISSRFIPDFRSNQFMAAANGQSWLFNQNIACQEELGIFHLGSTIILVVDGACRSTSYIGPQEKRKVQVGQSI